MIKKISLIIIASFFLSQKTNSKDFDLDRSLIEKGIVNEHFEVKNIIGFGIDKSIVNNPKSSVYKFLDFINTDSSKK